MHVVRTLCEGARIYPCRTMHATTLTPVPSPSGRGEPGGGEGNPVSARLKSCPFTVPLFFPGRPGWRIHRFFSDVCDEGFQAFCDGFQGERSMARADEL